MRLLALVAVVALCGGCAAPPRPDYGPVASETEIGAARTALLDCEMRAAPRYDDRMSDAATVGGAVAGACFAASEAVFDLTVRGQGPYRRDALRREWAALNARMATEVVLALRVRAK